MIKPHMVTIQLVADDSGKMNLAANMDPPGDVNRLAETLAVILTALGVQADNIEVSE